MKKALVAAALLKYALLAVPANAVRAKSLRLLARFIQAQGLAEAFAKADIGKPRLIKLDQQRHVIEQRAEAAIGPPDACGPSEG